MIRLYFCAESPSPTESDTEEEVIFNRILKINKGNTTKSLLIMGASTAFLGDVRGIMSHHNLCKYFSHLVHHHVRDAQSQTTVWSAEAPWHLESIVSI